MPLQRGNDDQLKYDRSSEWSRPNVPHKVDFSGVSDSFEPIPVGDYDAVFTGFKIDKSKSTEGAFNAVLEFTISDPEYSGRKAWANRSLLPQSLWVLKRAMVALGADADDLSGPIDLEEELDALKGADCRLRMSIREYEGRQNNQIDEVLAVGL